MERRGERRAYPQLAEVEEDDPMSDENVNVIIVSCECGVGDDEEELLLCHECNTSCHTKCTRPRLHKRPNGRWICRDCSGPPHVPSLLELDALNLNFFGIQNFNAEGKKRKRGHRHVGAKLNGIITSLLKR